MNKTIWQVLIVGAAAEAIMFSALIFKHGLTFGNIGRGYLFIFAVMFFYLSILRTFKSYNAALISSLAASVIAAFGFIYAAGAATLLASALFCAMSFFAHTFTYAEGLKHNQEKHFMLLSLALYAAALFFSLYAVIMPFLIYGYEAANKRVSQTRLLRKRMYFFILFAFLAIVINMSF